jgi:hypothetical protein
MREVIRGLDRHCLSRRAFLSTIQEANRRGMDIPRVLVDSPGTKMQFQLAQAATF